jgi:hydroxyacylglutathione hydrolase
MTEDLSRWRELRRTGRTENCYLVWDEITREAALFDMLADPDPLFKIIEAESVQLRHVFLTHEQSVESLRARCPKFLLHTNAKNVPPQHRNRPNDFIHLGNLRITNRGLIDDKVAYVVGNWPEDAPHVVIVGDMTSIPKESLQEKILPLPADTLVCPRHGPLTTVAKLTVDLAAQGR